jgi:molybdate transport system ATP-binding protein
VAGEIVLDIAHRFESGAGVRAALTRELQPGSILALFGPSGAGKTTLLRTIAGLLRPVSGRVVFRGDEWFNSDTGRFVPPQQRRIGFVVQNTALFPHLNVRANVEYGLHAVAAAARRRRADDLLELVGARGLEDRAPRQLSSGQAQRVALARALAPSPELLLLDEPFGALDLPTRRDLRVEIRRVLRQTGTSAILVTHDRLEALAMGDDLAVMIDGSLRQVGSAAQVFQRPADPDVARALGVETVVPAVVERVDGGLLSLRAGDQWLLVAGADECAPGDEVFACVRAEDVTLEPLHAVGGSARNRLPGTVQRVEYEGAIDRVTLDCGFLVVAVITRQSREELSLATGGRVTAVIKATAIHIVPKI